MANNLEIEAQRQALVTSIRDAAQALRECANKTDTFANYLQNVYPVPQPYSAISFHHVQSPTLPTGVPDGPPIKRRPGRPKKADHHDEDPAAPDDGALNGDGKKRKRQTKEKKPRDPNAPKRPPSAYLLYQNQVRKDVQQANPNLPYGEILTYISKAWGQLSDNDKAPYNSATEIAKAEYEKKKSAYEATLKAAEPVISPETVASVPAHQDTSEDDEPEQYAPVPIPAIVPTVVRVKSPSVPRPSYAARGAQVVKQPEESSDDDDDDDDDDEEDEPDKSLVPPPKKRARKSELPPPPPPPVVIKEKEKVKKERKKDKKSRE